MQTTSEYTVRVKLRGEDNFREYPNAISWALEDGIASVANGERVNCWPIELVEEWDVPRVEQAAQPAQPDQPGQESQDDSDWFQV